MKRLIFLHVPKTAGTSVINRMREAMSQECAAPSEVGVYDTGDFIRARDFHGKTMPEDWSFLYGHITAERILANASMDRYGNEILAMSFVREPLDRLISTYNYIATTKHHFWHERCISSDPKEFFDFLAGQEKNIQFRYLDCDRSIKWSFLVSSTRHVRETCAEAFHAVTGKHLPMSLFDRRLNVTKPFDQLGRARRLSRADFSDGEIAKFRDMHSTDAALYDLVAARQIVRTNPAWLLL